MEQLAKSSRVPSGRRLAHALAPIDRHMTAARAGASGGLTRYLAQLFFQVSDQFLDPLRGVRVRRHLPGELAVSQNLHFQFDAFVF